jgi:hypothetical protein
MADKTKLTKKELESLQDSLSNLRNAEAAFGQAAGMLIDAQANAAELRVKTLAAEAVIITMKEAFITKYGHVDINVQTGEFMVKEEVVEG